MNTPYNPSTGEGSDAIDRVKVRIDDHPAGPFLWIPAKLAKEPLAKVVAGKHSFEKAAVDISKKLKKEVSVEKVMLDFTKLWFQYDFEYWAVTCIRIKPKLTDETQSGELIPFRLNRGQRKYLKRLMKMVDAGVPVRVVLLKARQWGGSTLTQFFMIWMQMVRHINWNSVICAHIENSARIVQGMFIKATEHYPTIFVENIDGDGLQLRPYNGSTKTREIRERQCRISIGSSEKPESLRGEDVNMVHFSEVASFVATDYKTPEDLMQSLVSGVPYMPDTVIVYESTAKGVGNTFHRLWLDAESGKSGYDAVFVSWIDIEYYALNIAEGYETFIGSLTDYEKRLFDHGGATLEQINWYRHKSKEYSDRWRFMSEFPSFPIEAFQSSGNRYYPIEDVDRLRRLCTAPLRIGDISAADVYGTAALEDIRFSDDPNGKLKVWAEPDLGVRMENRYVVVMDVNRGTSKDADNGVICVIDRYWQKEGGVPEVVAEWCGHIMMRYFIWKGVQIAKWYDTAFLIVEANTPVSSGARGFEMESVMDEIAQYYPNQYCRTPAAQIMQGVPRKWGFWTDRSTKLMVCSHQQIVLHNDMYIERCLEAANEHDTFEVKPNGELGATEGSHDDRHITRAIGIWACYKHLPPPKEVTGRDVFFSTEQIVNESTII